MKNFNVVEVSLKNPNFRGRVGGFTKNNCLKSGGLRQFADLRRALSKRGGGVFEGG